MLIAIKKFQTEEGKLEEIWLQANELKEDFETLADFELAECADCMKDRAKVVSLLSENVETVNVSDNAKELATLLNGCNQEEDFTEEKINTLLLLSKQIISNIHDKVKDDLSEVEAMNPENVLKLLNER